MRLGAAAIALVLGLGSARAAELAGGPIDAGRAQHVAVRCFFNAGTASVTLGSPRITDVNGTAIAQTVDECGAGVLLPLRSCGIAASVSNGTVYSCEASVTPSKKDVRGVLEMRDPGGVSLQNIELR